MVYCTSHIASVGRRFETVLQIAQLHIVYCTQCTLCIAHHTLTLAGGRFETASQCITVHHGPNQIILINQRSVCGTNQPKMSHFLIVLKARNVSKWLQGNILWPPGTFPDKQMLTWGWKRDILMVEGRKQHLEEETRWLIHGAACLLKKGAESLLDLCLAREG